MKFTHYIDLACLELARDLYCGVPISEREEMITDVAHIHWAMTDGKWRVPS